MRKIGWRLALSVMISCWLVDSDVIAATRLAASCSQANVQAQIDAARDGDNILVPAGSCTWASGVTWSDKNISLIGTGINATVITANNSAVIVINTNKSSFRISGFTFTGSNASATPIKLTSEYRTTSPYYQKGWRMDHIRFNYAALNTAITIHGNNWGVIDNCIFDISGTGFYSILVNSYIDGEWPASMGDRAWSLPINLGSDEAVYVENNIFNLTNKTSGNDSVFDGYNGARAVYRYNTINGSYIQNHATRDDEHGGLKLEIYNNTFNGHFNNNTDHFIWPIMIRSGTGVIFNNTISNYQDNNVTVDNQRTCIAYAGRFTRCNGSNMYDGNTAGEYGWPCRDQIGRGSGVPMGVSQPSVPLYAWNNGASAITVNGDFELCATQPPPRLTTHIKTSGDPSPHTGGVLDYVNNGSTPKPGYTPYTYPHPLTRGLSPSSIQPPQNLHILEVTED